MPRIRYSDAVRDQAVRLVLESQKPITHVAEKFGCSVSTLQNWLRDHRQDIKGYKPDAKNSKLSDSKPGRHAVADHDVSAATFIPVNLIDPKSATIEIVTPDGFTLKLTDTDPQYIAELLGVLGSC